MCSAIKQVKIYFYINDLYIKAEYLFIFFVGNGHVLFRKTGMPLEFICV